MPRDLIKNYMNKVPVYVKSGSLLTDVVDILLHNNLTGAPVVNSMKQVIGFVSEQDCIHQLLVSSYHSEGVPPVDEVMRTEVVSISPEDLIIDLAKQMDNRRPKIYPVVDNGKLVGLITRTEVLQALKDAVLKAPVV